MFIKSTVCPIKPNDVYTSNHVFQLNTTFGPSLQTIKDAIEQKDVVQVEHIFKHEISNMQSFAIKKHVCLCGNARMFALLYDSLIIPRSSISFDPLLFYSAGQSGNLKLINKMIEHVQQLYRDHTHKFSKCLNHGLLGASKSGNLELGKLLIQMGASNFEDAYTESFKSHNHDMIENLKSFVSVFGRRSCFLDAFFNACRSGYVEYVKSVIHNIGTFFVGDGFKIACKEGQFEVVKMLLERIQEFEREEYVLNNLRNACYGGNINIVNLLLGIGANDFVGGLSGACEGGHLELVKRMLSLCESNQINVHKSSKRIVRLAFESGDLNVVKYIVEKYKEIPRNSWIYAVYGGNLNVLKYVLQKVPEPQFKTQKGLEELYFKLGYVDIYNFMDKYHDLCYPKP